MTAGASSKARKTPEGETGQMITGVHHFSLIAASEASVAFYEKLGFREYKRIKRAYDAVVLMRGHGMGLEIFLDPRHPLRGTPEPTGLRCLSLKVDAIGETAEALGLEIGPIMEDWIGEKFAVTADPDGNAVQLHE